MSAAPKTTRVPKKRLLILLCAGGVLFLVAVLCALIFLRPAARDGLPVLNLFGKVYTYGEPHETEKGCDVPDWADCSIETRTVDGRETVSAYCIRKDWPNAFGNRLVSIGGLRLGGAEADFLKRYPEARITTEHFFAGIYNPDETYETYIVCFSDGQPYAPEDFYAMLDTLPELEAEQTLRASHALLVHTIQDEINIIFFSDYYDTLQRMEEPFAGLYA